MATWSSKPTGGVQQFPVKRLGGVVGGNIAGQHAVNNAAEVREILNQGNNVMAVFQEHNHINEHKLVEGIHYCTLAALVEGSGPESNAFASADVFADGSLRVHGLYRQANHELETHS
ncbi:MAG: hypothetical protein ACODAD_13635 [Planctomycetota bacterium]